MKRTGLLFSMALLLSAQFSFAQVFNQTSGPNGGMVTAISTSTSGTIIAGTNNSGAFRSENNGQTWVRMTDGVTDNTITAVAIGSTGNVFLGTASHGFLRSENNGTSFTTVSDVTNSNITAIRTVGNSVYVGTSSGVFKSTDNGVTFTQMSGLTSSAVTSIGVDAAGNIVAGNEAGRIFISTAATPNAFIELPAQVTEAENFAVRALATDQAGTLYASFQNAGIFKLSVDFPIWQKVEFGFSIGTVTSIIIGSDKKIYISAEGNGIYRSDATGENFTSLNTGLTDNNVLSLTVNENSQVFVGTKTDGIFRSSSDGSTYTRIGLPVLTVSDITLLPDTRVVFAASNTTGIFVSKDDGQTWADLDYDLTDSTVTSIAATNFGYAVVGTRNGGIFTLKNDGSLITRIDTTPNLSGVNAVAISAIGNIYAGTDAGLFRMEGTAKKFTQITTGIGNTAVQSINVGSTGTIIVRTATAFYMSTDGTNFIEIPNSGALTGVIDVASSSQANIIAAATVNGVYRLGSTGTFDQITAGLEGKTVTSVAVDAAGNVIVGTTNGAYALTSKATSFTQIEGTSNFDVTAVTASKTTMTGNDGATDLLLGVRSNSVYKGSFQFAVGPESVAELPASVGSLGINMPNPVNSTMIIPFTLKAEQFVVLKIYDAMGMERQTVINQTIGAGAQTAAVSVANLPAGTYFYRLMIGGAASQRSFVVVR